MESLPARTLQLCSESNGTFVRFGRFLRKVKQRQIQLPFPTMGLAEAKSSPYRPTPLTKRTLIQELNLEAVVLPGQHLIEC